MGKFNLRRLDGGSILPHKTEASRAGLAKGQSAVEFAMVSLVFFLMLFGVMDFGWLMFARMNVQQAVDDGGRYASTGQESGGSGSRISSIIDVIQNEITVPLNNWTLEICSTPPGGTTASCNTANSTNPTGSGPAGAAGGPEYTSTVSLTTTVPLMTPIIGQFFPSAGYTFTATSTYENEPFNPSTTD
jgi:Flp pilus assembly protein TadG